MKKVVTTFICDVCGWESAGDYNSSSGEFSMQPNGWMIVNLNYKHSDSVRIDVYRYVCPIDCRDKILKLFKHESS